MVTWLTPAELPARWSDASDIDDGMLQEMLDAAADACEAWLPEVGDPERPRDTTIRLAQLALVRGMWNDAIGDETGSIGGEGFDYNPPWLAREARRMMRPPRGGVPATGHETLPLLVNPEIVEDPSDPGTFIIGLTPDPDDPGTFLIGGTE